MLGPQEQALADLEGWKNRENSNFYSAYVGKVNAWFLGSYRANAINKSALEFSVIVAQKIAPLVKYYDNEMRRPNLVTTTTELGHNIQVIELDPAHHEAGRLIWSESSIAELAGNPGHSFQIATLFEILGLEGEIGHNCPIACTVGAIRAVNRRGSPISKNVLEDLVTSNYSPDSLAAQFATEAKGGSDIGENDTRAIHIGNNVYEISGQKFFCSVSQAGYFVVIARFDDAKSGTVGLGCFIVPRYLKDGRQNGFLIENLKDKIGTRCLSTGEIVFEKAIAYPIGNVENGFKIFIEDVLNTSRWLNAIGSVSMLRRSYEEALSYAVHRHVKYGQKSRFSIIEFPVIKQALANIKMEWMANLHSTWYLTKLDERTDLGELSMGDRDYAMYRVFINANKVITSITASKAIDDAIDVFGGNGVIQDFSVLPRLRDDVIVYQQWEGPHNVLAAQVLNDLRQHPEFIDVIISTIQNMLPKESSNPHIVNTIKIIKNAMDELKASLKRSLPTDSPYGPWHFFRSREPYSTHMTELVRALQIALLSSFANDTKDESSAAAAEQLALNCFFPGYKPENDQGYIARTLKILGDDINF